jgi:hypothetical protein
MVSRFTCLPTVVNERRHNVSSQSVEVVVLAVNVRLPKPVSETMDTKKKRNTHRHNANKVVAKDLSIKARQCVKHPLRVCVPFHV